MQPPFPTAHSIRPAVAPDVIKLMVRSSRGDGTRVFTVEAPASGTIADVKQLLCRPPHSMCSDASALVLVLKGKGAAVARASQCILDDVIDQDLTRFQAASCTMILPSLRLLSRRTRS